MNKRRGKSVDKDAWWYRKRARYDKDGAELPGTPKTPQGGEATGESTAESKGSEAGEKSAVKTPKHKYGLLMGYNGREYRGMQINPGVVTVESILLPALGKAGLIAESNAEDLNKNGFQRCARTDKGVHAARQLCSVKLQIADGDRPQAIANINNHLPEAIRVFGFVRATKKFNAKNDCSGRLYEYLTPTYAFAPCDEAAETGFRMSAALRERVNLVLAHYVGTRNMHNFTTGKAHDDPSAKRFLISFTCGEPHTRNGLEYVVLSVEGQSFLLHQIRKMVGLCMAVVRGNCPEAVYERCFSKQRVDTPMAPALGLLLADVYFRDYNKHFGATNGREDMCFATAASAADAFKRDTIYATIAREEVASKDIHGWLSSLASMTYEPNEPRLFKKDLIAMAAAEAKVKAQAEKTQPTTTNVTSESTTEATASSECLDQSTTTNLTSTNISEATATAKGLESK